MLVDFTLVSFLAVQMWIFHQEIEPSYKIDEAIGDSSDGFPCYLPIRPSSASNRRISPRSCIHRQGRESE